MNHRPSRRRLSFVRAGVAVLLLMVLATLGVSAAGASGATGIADASWRSVVGKVRGAEASGSISTVVRDGDDTAGGLDIRIARSRVDAATGHATRLRYVIRTYEAVRASTLHHRWRRIVLELDTDGQPGAERSVLVGARDGQLSAELISNATREVLDRLRVRQSSPTTLRVSGTRAQLGARKLFWTADWHRRGDSACDEVDGWPLTCQDSVPDDGWLRLDRPAWP